MTPALLLSAFLSLAAAAPAGDASSGAFRQAQLEFNRGNFPAALRDLDVAAGETSSAGQLAQIYLLRGQIYSALRDPPQTERAFERALTYDPDGRLDPARVDPSLVSLLESLRQRLRGELRVETDPSAATVLLDGKPIGSSPVQARVAIGRHTVEAQSADGHLRGSSTVIVFPKRSTGVQLRLVEAPPPVHREPPPPRPEGAPSTSSATGFAASHPLADVRLGFDPFQYSQGVTIEVGGGVAWTVLRLSLSARVFPDFGAIPRGAVAVPIGEDVHGYVEMEVPIVFPPGGISVGLGGAAGIEYAASAWLSVFGQVGARYYFTGPLDDRIPLQAGARLRVP